MSKNNSRDYLPYIEHINTLDVFYVKDVLIHFDIKRQDNPTQKESIVDTIIRRAKKSGCIQCCGKNGSNTQYILIKKIMLDVIYIRNIQD